MKQNTNELFRGKTDYKEIIRGLFQRKQEKDSNLTYKELAKRIPIQATYLSKFFNNDNSHLKDETLFRLAKILGLNEAQSDYLILLKDYQCCETPERKLYLHKKIHSEQEIFLGETKRGQGQVLEHESKYLLNPLCVVVHAGLDIPKFRDNPRLFASPLGLSTQGILEILDILEDNQFISRGEDLWEIKEIFQRTLHFSADHPLMRIHQNLFRTLLSSKAERASELEKKSFLATFSMDKAGMEEVKNEFQVFVEKVKKINQKSKEKELYQMSFDLFKWF